MTPYIMTGILGGHIIAKPLFAPIVTDHNVYSLKHIVYTDLLIPRRGVAFETVSDRFRSNTNTPHLMVIS